MGYILFNNTLYYIIEICRVGTAISTRYSRLKYTNNWKAPNNNFQIYEYIKRVKIVVIKLANVKGTF